MNLEGMGSGIVAAIIPKGADTRVIEAVLQQTLHYSFALFLAFPIGLVPLFKSCSETEQPLQLFLVCGYSQEHLPVQADVLCCNRWNWSGADDGFGSFKSAKAKE